MPSSLTTPGERKKMEGLEINQFLKHNVRLARRPGSIASPSSPHQCPSTPSCSQSPAIPTQQLPHPQLFPVPQLFPSPQLFPAPQLPHTPVVPGPQLPLSYSYFHPPDVPISSCSPVILFQITAAPGIFPTLCQDFDSMVGLYRINQKRKASIPLKVVADA